MRNIPRILAAALVFVAFSVSYEEASAEFDQKVCLERCLEKTKDKERCEYICDPKQK